MIAAIVSFGFGWGGVNFIPLFGFGTPSVPVMAALLNSSRINTSGGLEIGI